MPALAGPTPAATALGATAPPPTIEKKAEPPAVPEVPLDRNKFEDEFPVMFKFYRERGVLPDFHFQKVQEIQRRWKTGSVFWLTHDNQEIEIPEWVAVNVVINNKANVQRGARICMSLNHTKGYGCNRRGDGACSYVHECALCGQEDHGVFQKRANGAWVCNKLRKWNEEEERFTSFGYGDPWKQDEMLTEMARKVRSAAKAPTTRVVSAGGVPPAPRSPAPWAGVHSFVADTVKLSGEETTAAGAEESATAPAATGKDQLDDTAATESVASGGVDESSTTTTQDVPDNDTSSSRTTIAVAPPPAQPPPPPLPPDWQAIWSDEQAKYYYWYRPTNKVTWDIPEYPDKESGGAVVAGNSEASPEDEIKKVEFESDDHRPFICHKHWRPKKEAESCIRVIQGDRIIVTWSSGDPQGWVYGHVEEDPKRIGYMPRTVLTQVYEDPRCRATGELLTVSKPFGGPEDVNGYLTVEPGDVLRVVAPMEPPYVWAYVERAGGAEPAVGWVPEVVLKDVTSTPAGADD